MCRDFRHVGVAYLHPNHFQPNPEIVKSYGIGLNDTSAKSNEPLRSMSRTDVLNGEQNPFKPYFVMRFASLNAHHDSGIKGINTEIAQRLIDILAPHGTIYITSERPLEPQFEQYRIRINPLDMHHVMG